MAAVWDEEGFCQAGNKLLLHGGDDFRHSRNGKTRILFADHEESGDTYTLAGKSLLHMPVGVKVAVVVQAAGEPGFFEGIDEHTEILHR